MLGTKTATALFMVATGSKFETSRSSGISHFLEHMFFKGTVKRPTTLALSSELDKLGGEYNAFTSKEYTGFWVKVEASRLGPAVEVLADMMLNSKLEAAEIEREKGVIIEELNMYLDNPLLYIEDLFEQCLYGDSPAGWDTIGTKANILRFKRPDVMAYWRSQYSAEQSLICLAGKLPFCHSDDPELVEGEEESLIAGERESSIIDPSSRGFGTQDDKKIAAFVNKYFKHLSKNVYKDKPAVTEAQKQPQVKLHYKKTDQAHLSLGVRALPFGHRDELAQKILSAILGGSMSSRLFTNLRERHGLAYYVRTNSETYTDSGYVTTRAGVPVDKVNQAASIILAEYKKLVTEKVEARELNKVKQMLTGRAALELESSDDIASWYARQAMLFHEQKQPAKIQTPEDYYRELKRITAEDVLKVAREIFVNNKLNLAVIGPYKHKDDLENILKM